MERNIFTLRDKTTKKYYSIKHQDINYVIGFNTLSLVRMFEENKNYKNAFLNLSNVYIDDIYFSKNKELLQKNVNLVLYKDKKVFDEDNSDNFDIHEVDQLEFKNYPSERYIGIALFYNMIINNSDSLVYVGDMTDPVFNFENYTKMLEKSWKN
jgi:hypothetical protein